MVLAAYIAVNLLIVVSFAFMKKKNFHVLEVFAYWCFAISLFLHFSAISFLNINYIDYSDRVSLTWADTLNRIILLPIIVIIYLNWLIGIKSFSVKGFVTVLFSGILYGIDSLNVWIGMYSFNYGQRWWQFFIYLFILVLSAIFMRMLRYFFYRKGRSNEFYI